METSDNLDSKSAKRKHFLLAVILIALTFTFSCSDDKDDGGDPSGSNKVIYGPSVPYNGKTYKSVKIGTQTWMSENLNYDVDGSRCYADNPANCDQYGRLYDWATAMALPASCNSNSCSGDIKPKHQGICPSGWHIPSNEDWDKLLRYVDGTSGTSSPYDSETAGEYLQWASSCGYFEDVFSFSALMGGYGYSGGNFFGVGQYGGWWSASEYSSIFAYGRDMWDCDQQVLYDSDNDKSFLFSVRCLQD